MSSEDPRIALAQAEKAVKTASGGISFFGGKTEKWETAADLYTKAAALFRKNNDRKRCLPIAVDSNR
jgi:alpha-soluble NSF attachment protein